MLLPIRPEYLTKIDTNNAVSTTVLNDVTIVNRIGVNIVVFWHTGMYVCTDSLLRTNINRDADAEFSKWNSVSSITLCEGAPTMDGRKAEAGPEP